MQQTHFDGSKAYKFGFVIKCTWSQCRWHHQELTIKLPLELSCILEIYLAAGHKLVSSQAAGTSSDFVFMDKKGRPMSESQSMTIFWQDFLRKAGCRVIFPPHRYAYFLGTFST